MITLPLGCGILVLISTGQFAFQQYNATILYDWCKQNKEKWNIPFTLVTSIIKPQQQCLSEQPERSHLNKPSCFRNLILFSEEKRQAVSISVSSLAVQVLRLRQITPTSYRHLIALTKYCMAVSQIKCKARSLTGLLRRFSLWKNTSSKWQTSQVLEKQVLK